MRFRKTELGDWETRQTEEREPNLLRDTNRTLWIVVGGGLVIALILMISFFAASRLFPSFFFFGSEDLAATMNRQEIKLDEYEYYFYTAAVMAEQEPSYWETRKRAKELQNQAFELLQTDRLYPLLMEELGLALSPELKKEQKKALEEFEQNRNTPLFQYQLMSKGITESLQKSLITADSCKKALQEYVAEQTEYDTLYEKALEIYEDSYVKVRWIRFSLVDDKGNPLSQEEQEQLRTKSYGIYQQLQSDRSFEQMQDSLWGEKHILVYDQLLKKGQMPDSLEEVAFALEVNEIGNLVETEQAIFLMQRIDAEEGFASQQQAMLFQAQEKLFEEWIDSWRKEYPVKPYHKNIKKLDTVTMLETFFEQKKTADKQIEYMEKSQ
ncbi:MAG: hypothetical protein E7399_04715 [Ruminococcaceae bacterium]|nr:hypothetical protein [Oscillospiraceae bacterium]